MSDEGQREADVSAWKQACELIHGHLQRAAAELEAVSEPPLGLRAAASLVEDLLRQLYEALDGRADPLEAIVSSRTLADAALAELEPGRGSQGPLESVAQQLEGVAEVLREVEEVVARARPAASREAGAPLCASVGLPSLHRLDRPLLLPHLRVAETKPSAQTQPFEPLPPPTSHEELEGHADRAREHIERHLARVFAARDEPKPPDDEPVEDEPVGSDQPSPEELFVARWARECFDEIAMLGSQRRPLLGDDWRTSEELEQRLLTSLDAFAALGPGAFATLETLVLDAPAPDPERLFAAGLLTGVLAGRDALGLGERLARASARDPLALHRYAAAVALAPHPDVGAMLRDWLEDGDPRYRQVATQLLTARGDLAADELARLAEDRPEIAAHTLVPLALAHPPSLEPLFERALAATHLPLRRAGWLALALTAPPRAREQLRAELGGRYADEAAWLLAAIGSRADAEKLGERALRQPTPSSLGALAVAGHVASIEGLLHLLAHDDEPLRLAAANALDRLTGAGLRAEVAIGPERLDAPDLPEPDVGGFAGPPPLQRLVSDPRDQPGEGSPDRVEVPTPEPAPWRAWWQDNRARFEAERRYRRGAPFAPSVVLDELAGPWLSPAERAAAGDELLLLTRIRSGFDPDALVPMQQQALERWRAALIDGAAGGWPA